jgi:uncharacterized protein with ParB-like and HNH nuclease domain
VFIHEGTYSTNEVKELVIIDGQQRLTTINILYVVLHRFVKVIDKEQNAFQLKILSAKGLQRLRQRAV